DGQDANCPQRLGRTQGQVARLLGDDRPDRRRHERAVEDVPLVAVQRDRVAHGAAVMATGHDDRDLGGEVDPSLGDARRPAQAGRTVRRRANHRSAGAETFSNSTVIASARSANVRKAGRWSSWPRTVHWATWAAGVSSTSLRTPAR